MQSRSIAIKILYWLEVIISARILLFTIPVLLNALSSKAFGLKTSDDFFIVMLTVLGVYYLTVGIFALAGKSITRILHLIGFALIISLSFYLWDHIESEFKWDYNRFHFIIPVVFSLFFTVMDLLLGKATAAQAKMKWQSILIIDDDETLIKTVRPMLMSNGYSVLTSNTGEEGLRVARAQKPDLILLDVIMPGMKGRDVCLAIKESDETKKIPVVFLTAKDSQEDIDAELAAGGEAHLTKPVNRDALLSTVQTLLDKK